ncbi:ATP-binding protein [Arthrobacter sp. Bz4]|uniref:ATP-binding protein n=1 Tax=Arthrobacter sp. Bz4 TaxID=2171979 RepID=UPI000D517230|nr:ATP-binding protein [Arthrobacter sp. Bz4]PVE15052.1 histidine kinase [Arthrobacter sp. Bz4]
MGHVHGGQRLPRRGRDGAAGRGDRRRLVGGLWPALLAALLGTLVLNYFSTAPVGSLEITDPQNLFTLIVFIGVAVAVSLVVGMAADRSREAAAATAEAATLGELARGVLAAEDTLQGFLAHVRTHFGVPAVALFERTVPAAQPTLISQDTGQDTGQDTAQGTGQDAGQDTAAPLTLDAADTTETLPDGLVLALYGRTLTGRDQGLLAAFGTQLTAMRQRQELITSTQTNRRLSEGNVMRTAILRAVSHDLRTPLAGIKLAVSSLRHDAVQLPKEEEAELLETIEDYSDRLDALINNLLDMSRLTGDAVTPHLRAVHWVDVLPGALVGLPAQRVRVEVPGNLPPVTADPGMLERVIANLVENAHKYAGGEDIVITGSVEGTVGTADDAVPAGELRIVDHGRGVNAEDASSIFQPFRRATDAPAGAGVGLGLAVAKGFTEVMGGELTAGPTPGGGLTLRVRLPLATGHDTGRDEGADA